MRFRKLAAGALLAGALAMGTGLAPAFAQEEDEEHQETEIGHAEEECIHLLEEGEPVSACQEAPNPILPATNELVFGALSFALLFGLMYKFAYPAVAKAMEARTARIRENLDDAERVRTEAQTILEEYQRQLADARNEANRIIEEARQTADQLRRDLMQRAEAEVNELKQRTQDDINAARDRTMGELREQVAGLAIELAEKVVESNLDRQTNLALIERYIEQVGSQR
ncbi:MAG TPA: F0F1 ATP synthase subunit B [Acidimicrobiales bacterium]|nr:F0F1 ATP synthase subunit B [Acidimicrobiales bacterium]